MTFYSSCTSDNDLEMAAVWVMNWQNRVTNTVADVIAKYVQSSRAGDPIVVSLAE